MAGYEEGEGECVCERERSRLLCSFIPSLIAIFLFCSFHFKFIKSLIMIPSAMLIVVFQSKKIHPECRHNWLAISFLFFLFKMCGLCDLIEISLSPRKKNVRPFHPD